MVRWCCRFRRGLYRFCDRHAIIPSAQIMVALLRKSLPLSDRKANFHYAVPHRSKVSYINRCFVRFSKAYYCVGLSPYKVKQNHATHSERYRPLHLFLPPQAVHGTGSMGRLRINSR